MTKGSFLRFLAASLVAIVSGVVSSNADTQITGNRPMVRLTTSAGIINIELFAEAAPATVDNFIEYVEAGFYDGLIFHRVIPGFMIQGGGFKPGMQRTESRSPIENEADNGLKNDSGTLAMARTNDPHSASSQFFINLVDNDFLNHTGKTPQGWGYAVFGRVIDGMDVAQSIASVPRGQVGAYGDVPNDDVIIEKAELVSE